MDDFNSESRAGLERFARAGYLARGVIYYLIGGLALFGAFGFGGGTEDPKGALRYILHEPGGWAAVAILACGLAGFSGWRLYQAVADPEFHGRDVRGVATRAGMFISGVAHGGLALWAGRSAFGFARRAAEHSERSWIAWLMIQPFGRSMVGICGLALIGVGIAQFLNGWKKKFEKRLCCDESLCRVIAPICSFGLYARGVVFVIIGFFVVYAAVRVDPHSAGGIPDALDWLRAQRYGKSLLVLTALGLVAFGVYSTIEGFYRRVST